MTRSHESVTPRVSILMPVHDAAPTLGGCLRSLARQSEPRWECVAVDDGSCDGSGDLLRHAANIDPRIRVVTTPHRGIVSALSEGLTRCRAPIVARMDADDWMHRDRLALQLALLSDRPDVSAVGTHVRMFPRAALRNGRRRYENWLNGMDSADGVRRDAFVECPVAHPTLAVRTDVLNAFGYRSCGWPEDYDLVLRMLGAGHEIGVVPKRLIGWRDSPDRLSRTGSAYGLDRFTECKAAHLAAGFLASSERYVLWGYGSTGRALRRALLTHGRTPSHIVELHPRRIGQCIHGSPVITPEGLRDLPHEPVVVSVAGEQPRALIRGALTALGRVELRDFVCAA